MSNVLTLLNDCVRTSTSFSKIGIEYISISPWTNDVKTSKRPTHSEVRNRHPTRQLFFLNFPTRTFLFRHLPFPPLLALIALWSCCYYLKAVSIFFHPLTLKIYFLSNLSTIPNIPPTRLLDLDTFYTPTCHHSNPIVYSRPKSKPFSRRPERFLNALLF